MDINKLKAVDDKEFNRVWQIMKEMYESERHFNQLETSYRILASQWLLAAFAGIGFVMTSDPNLSFDKLWLVVGICYISGIGIWQLWRMDMLIYHRLLSACFSAGIDLEKEFDFLPKVKNRMLHSVPQKDVTHVLFYFYFFGIATLSLMGFGIFSYLSYDKFEGWTLIMGSVIVAGILCWMFFNMKKKSREKWITEL